ncbi:transmembrane glycosyltransferase, partial [bacterium]|nr:transmembrane glycosyltransferase [bacterium]
ITYDTLFIALQYMGYALKGKPYMGVGRNMAYRKEVFFRMKGFASNLHLRSGDDDLIVNAAANAFNTKVEVSSESVTWSEPNKTLRDWLFQKERHLSVSSFYSSKSKFRLSLEPFMRGLFYLSFISLLIFGNFISMIAAGMLFLIRAISQLVIINKSS